MTNLKVGDQAPDFTLLSSSGKEISLSQFFGKRPVVLFFYSMDESPVCSREAEAFWWFTLNKNNNQVYF
jgi:thioredoxin-dependent peroxiredoxin